MRVFNKVKSLLMLPNSVYNGASAITRCIMRRYSASDLLNIQEVSVVVARLCVDGSSGFGWDSETKKFTADAEVWNVYLQAHPNNTYLREDLFQYFEELKTVFEQNTATGQCCGTREIPDLDDDLRYEEMTLVHCLGMKSVVAPPPDFILQRTLDISPLFLLVLFWVPNFLFAENTKHLYQL
uniref:At2g29880-like C-terminal domain-containing protein n=1 Tax=Brassica oleracea var. oleracea TaxID=109376 RepID=A0A0D3BGT5_BRAOL